MVRWAQRQAGMSEKLVEGYFGLAAIGQMVAGLAHESRNALQRSQSCLSLLGLRLCSSLSRKRWESQLRGRIERRLSQKCSITTLIRTTWRFQPRFQPNPAAI